MQQDKEAITEILSAIAQAQLALSAAERAFQDMVKSMPTCRKSEECELELLLEYCESMMTSEYPVWRRDCEALRMLIAALRPVSREQVILCKDCQYWQGNNGGYPHPECRWGNDETPDEDDYCSFAERLEVSKNS